MPPPPGASNLAPSPDDLAERIRALSTEFAMTLKGNVDEIRSNWAELPRESGLAAMAPGLSRIHDIAHNLAGTGQSLGFPRISQTAAPLDSLFRLLQEKQNPLTTEEIDQIDLLITDLEIAVDIPGEEVILDGLHAGYEFSSHRGTFYVLLFGGLDPKIEAISALAETGYILSPVAGGSPPVDVSTGAPSVLLATLEKVSEARRGGKKLLADGVLIQVFAVR